MRRISNAAFLCAIFVTTVFSSLFVSNAAWAIDSAEAFMSVTFGLPAARTQRRMENSGAEAFDFVRDGRLAMRGTFEHRSAIFIFGFHERRGLNHKAVYIASSGDAESDRALYDAFRSAYNSRFGRATERATPNRRVRGRITLQNSWRPNRDTVITLAYDPEVTNRFPGDSLGERPIHLIYSFTGWSR